MDLHGIVQAVLENQQNHQDDFNSSLSSYPNPEVVPNSILGVRDVGLGPSQRLFEPLLPGEGRHYLLNPPEPTKNIGDEKLYYIKEARPKVFVNFRGRTGNFRQGSKDSRLTMKQEPSLFLRATEPYQMVRSKEIILTIGIPNALASKIYLSFLFMNLKQDHLNFLRRSTSQNSTIWRSRKIQGYQQRWLLRVQLWHPANYPSKYQLHRANYLRVHLLHTLHQSTDIPLFKEMTRWSRASFTRRLDRKDN